MISDKPGPLTHNVTPYAGERDADFRARLALQHAEAVERRRQELLEQTSMLNTPEQRIRVWERLHQVTLPRRSTHQLLRVIAEDTGLTLEQVLVEQHRRTLPAAAPAVAADPFAPSSAG
jgi:hypothetical protein